MFYGEYPILSASNVYCITQDSSDRLYFGTDSGLIRYDGVSVYRYEHMPFDDSTICSCHISTCYMEADDTLWIGTKAGLDKLDTDTGHVSHYPDAGEAISVIFRDSKGRLWIGTAQGLSLCTDEANKTFTVFNTKDAAHYLGAAAVHSVSEDSKGRIFASTDNGVWEYRPAAGTFQKTALIPSGCLPTGTSIRTFIEDNGTYWMAAWGVGLIHIFPDTNTYTVHRLGHNCIYTLYNNFINNNYIAIGTQQDGLYIFDKTTNSVEQYADNSKKNKLTNNNVYAFFIDKYGIFYAGTDGFVNTADTNLVLNKIAVPIYPQKKHRREKATPTKWEVRNLAYTTGFVWALFDGVLVRYSVEHPQITEFALPAASTQPGHTNPAAFLCAPDDSTLLINSSHTLYQFDTVQCQFEPVSIYGGLHTQFKHWKITALCRTGDGAIWIGTQQHGLICADRKNQTIKTYATSNDTCSLQSDTILFIKQDKKEQLWIGTERGLYRYDSARDDFTVYLYRADNPSGISANAVNTFCEDSAGTLWFGTDGGGMFSFDPLHNTFQTYTTAHGLSSNRIISITDAGHNCLWVTTLHDLHLFNTEKGSIQFYDMTDSIQYNYFSCRPLAIHEQNVLFLGTDNGLIQLSQSALNTFLVRKVPVRIQSMKVEREEINVSRRKTMLSFDYTQNDIKFYFSAPHFFPIKKIAYAYKLDGFDEDWVVVSDRNYALYTSLPPGTYTFLVKNSTEPDSASDSIAFTIRPNFFFSAPMIALYILLVLLFLFLMYKTSRLYLINQYTQSLEQKQKNLIQDNITLQELSMIDYLTNIGNRRSIDIMSEQILQKAKENKAGLSVILIDVDFFKKYNDTYGHQAGDIVLKFIATALKTRIRSESDLIGRYGGEEFLIVLYNTTLKETLKIADEMRLSVENLYTQFKEYIQEKITISIGLHTEQSKNIRIFTDMIYKADCALYDAKNTGRNKVCVYEEKNTRHSSWIINGQP